MFFVPSLLNDTRAVSHCIPVESPFLEHCCPKAINMPEVAAEHTVDSKLHTGCVSSSHGWPVPSLLKLEIDDVMIRKWLSGRVRMPKEGIKLI